MLLVCFYCHHVVSAVAADSQCSITGLHLQDDEHAYIVQELCAGGDLKGLLDQKGKLNELEAATIMRGVLDVLVECHRRQICYGDLKVCSSCSNKVGAQCLLSYAS